MPQAPRALHVVGGFTIDAIVRADGSWATGQLGGNALWAAMSIAQFPGALPVAHSGIGIDYPESALSRIASHGVDVSNVRQDEERGNARVTFAYGQDGSRSQPAPASVVGTLPRSVQPEFADTTRDDVTAAALLPRGGRLTGAVAAGARAWHLGLLPSDRFTELVTALKGAGASYVQADCPARFEIRRDGDGVLRDVLPQLDAFLPSSSDTDVFAPGDDHEDLVRRFHRYGAPVVVLKRGDQGALVSEAGGRTWSVPAFPLAREGDPTGAGDVFCGAFAYLRSTGTPLLEAAVHASARASYAVEASCPLDYAAPSAQDLTHRIEHIRKGVIDL